MFQSINGLVIIYCYTSLRFYQLWISYWDDPALLMMPKVEYIMIWQEFDPSVSAYKNRWRSALRSYLK